MQPNQQPSADFSLVIEEFGESLNSTDKEIANLQSNADQDLDGSYADENPCPVCKSLSFRSNFTRSGVLFSILFFPVGLLFGVFLTEKECETCGFKS